VKEPCPTHEEGGGVDVLHVNRVKKLEDEGIGGIVYNEPSEEQ
jgi:hypothetical protein